MISVAKAAADPAGHYARPDVTRLLFNNRPGHRVETLALPIDEEGEANERAEADKSPDRGASCRHKRPSEAP